MPHSIDKMKILLSNKTQLVLFFESNVAPDIRVLKLLKRLSASKSKHHSLKNVIVVCHLYHTHKRLTHAVHLEILFSIKKHKNFSAIQKIRNKKSKPEFAIEKICIQKKTACQRESFEQFYNEFCESRENKLVFNLNEIFQLIPVAIPKPWGQEIWYSGIEARGVASIKTLGSVDIADGADCSCASVRSKTRGAPRARRARKATSNAAYAQNDNCNLHRQQCQQSLGRDPAVKPRDGTHDTNPAVTSMSSRGLTAGSIPLSWIIGAIPTLLLGKKFAHKDPVLIKILDPSPQDIIGDLYYELHLEKNEVYVVTDIADGCGKIKIGIDEQKLKLYDGNQQKFKDDFLKSIVEYEKTRRQIDDLKDLQEKIPHHLIEQEILLRKQMNSFCGFIDLNIGDVINVPIHVPHALQHGVKVIEFQTPTYERLIISFAQKVLTQSHWDTKRAFDFIELKPFYKKTLKILLKTKDILKELVCEFADFKVSRWTLNANAHAHRKCEIARKQNYRILFVVSGSIALGSSILRNTQVKKNQLLLKDMCILIPQNINIALSAKEKSVFLICEPNLNKGC